MAKSAVNIAGCVYSVCLSLCSASLSSSLESDERKTNPERVSPPNTSTMVSSA